MIGLLGARRLKGHVGRPEFNSGAAQFIEKHLWGR
jgi:hypothetical protein